MRFGGSADAKKHVSKCSNLPLSSTEKQRHEQEWDQGPGCTAMTKDIPAALPPWCPWPPPLLQRAAYQVHEVLTLIPALIPPAAAALPHQVHAVLILIL